MHGRDTFEPEKSSRILRHVETFMQALVDGGIGT